MSIQVTNIEHTSNNIISFSNGRASIVNINGDNNRINLLKQYPYTYKRTKNGSGLAASIAKWVLKSLISACFVVVLYPLLLPVYIILIIHWQYNLISNRDQLKGKYFKDLFQKCIFHMTSYAILTILSLFLGPILFLIYHDNDKVDISNSFSFVPTILFFLFRKSILLRLARWHLKERKTIPIKYVQSNFPKWFLKYFIQSGLCLHTLLIKDYDESKIYLSICQDKLHGKFTIIDDNSNECNSLKVERFILDFWYAKNFYDKEHYFYRWLLTITIFIVLPTPFIFYQNVLDLIIHIILSIGVAWIFYAIWMEIEGRIIYALLKYLDVMRQFGELLCMDKDLKKNKYDRIYKGETGSKKDMDRAKEIGRNSDDIIRLCHGYNANVWVENWLMMYTEANIYFKNFQYIFFSVMVTAAIAVFVVIYNLILAKTQLLSPQVIVFGIGFLNVILIWSELLVISFKFSRLEKRHMESLINQKIWIQQQIVSHTFMNENIDSSKIFHLEQTINLIDHLYQKMELYGLSPKIAGISMNKAFVRVTWSLIISIITAGIGYYLRKNV